jgi:hypothetical protein
VTEQFETHSDHSNQALETIVREIYLQLLHRDASKDELESATRSLSSDPVGAVVAMAHSEELVANLLRSLESRRLAANAIAYVFKFVPIEVPDPKYFLHLPKTAGTAISSHIQEHSSFPWHLHTQLSHTNLWPLISGHLHWSYFPQSSRGFSIFRDPIERLLSSWLFMTSRRQMLSNEFRHLDLVNNDFTRYLERGKTDETVARMSVGASWYFTHTPTDILSYQGLKTSDPLNSFSEALKHISHFGCVEDPESIQNVLKFATETDTKFLREDNRTDRTGSEPQSLTQAEYGQLFEMTKFEYQFLNFLFEKGLISFNYNIGIEERLLRYLSKVGLTVG